MGDPTKYLDRQNPNLEHEQQVADQAVEAARVQSPEIAAVILGEAADHIEADQQARTDLYTGATDRLGVPSEVLADTIEKEVQPDGEELADAQEKLSALTRALRFIKAAFESKAPVEPTNEMYTGEIEHESEPVIVEPTDEPAIPEVTPTVTTGPVVDGVRTPFPDIDSSGPIFDPVRASAERAGQDTSVNIDGVVRPEHAGPEVFINPDHAAQFAQENPEPEIDYEKIALSEESGKRFIDTVASEGGKFEHSNFCVGDKVTLPTEKAPNSGDDSNVYTVFRAESGVYMLQQESSDIKINEPEIVITEDKLIEAGNTVHARGDNDEAFQARLAQEKGPDKKSSFAVGSQIKLPWRLSPEGNSSFEITRSQSGVYMASQKLSSGEIFRTVCTESAIRAAGNLDEADLEDSRFDNEPANIARSEAIDKVFDAVATEESAVGKPLDLKVGTRVQLPKYMSQDDNPDWTIQTAKNGHYRLIQTTQHGVDQFLIATQKDLELHGLGRDIESAKKMNEYDTAEQKGLSSEELNKLLDSDSTIAYAGKKLDDLRLLSNKITYEIDTLTPAVGKKLDNRKITKQTIATLNEHLAAVNNIVNAEMERRNRRGGRQESSISQHHYRTAIIEAAVKQLVLDAQADPEQQAKLSRLVGTSVHFDSQGGGSLVHLDGTELAKLSPDQIKQAKLVVLKEQLKPHLIRQGTEADANYRQGLKSKNEELNAAATKRPVDEDQVSDLRSEIQAYQQYLDLLQAWMQRIQRGEFEINLDDNGDMEVEGFLQENPLALDPAIVKNQQDVVELQSSKLYQMRQAINESNQVPADFREAVSNGYFSFVIDSNRNINVAITQGNKVGTGFQLSADLTQAVLDGKKPKGMVEKPDVATQLAQQEADRQEQKDQAAGDSDDLDDDAAEHAEVEVVDVQTERDPLADLHAASRAILARFMAFATSPYGGETFRAIKEKLDGRVANAKDGETIGVRRDNQGNLIFGIIGEDRKRLQEPIAQIAADSQEYTTLNNAMRDQIQILGRMEFSIGSVGEHALEYPSAAVSAEASTSPDARVNKSPRAQIADLVQGFGTTIDAGEQAQLIKLIGQLDADDKVPTVIEALKNQTMSTNIDDALAVMTRSLNASERDQVAQQALENVYQTAGLDNAIKLANFMGSARARNAATRKIAALEKQSFAKWLAA